MGDALPIIAVGAGRVFQRLYLPALARVPGLELVAVADPSPVARALIPDHSIGFESIETALEMPCAGMLVLSPGELHAAHAEGALSRGVPVLLEKPSAMTASEIVAWRAEWRRLVTPARPRRYWPRYLSLRKTLSADARLSLALHTSPAAWGAGAPDRVADDLLPHLIDLAGWLTKSDVTGADGSVDDARGAGTFSMRSGRNVDWDVAHGDGHVERVSAGPLVVDVARQSAVERAAERLRLRPPVAVLGVARMLHLWERRLRGEFPPGLPGFADAETEVRVRESLRGA